MPLEQTPTPQTDNQITTKPFDHEAGHVLSIPASPVDAKIGGMPRELGAYDSLTPTELPDGVTSITDAPSLRDSNPVSTQENGANGLNTATQLETTESDPINSDGMPILAIKEPSNFLSRAMQRIVMGKEPVGTRTHQKFDPKAEKRHRDKINQKFGGPVDSHIAPKF